MTSEASGSRRSKTLSAKLTTLTLEPSLANACAISTPMTPPPTTAKCSGLSVCSKTLKFVSLRSSGRPGTGMTSGFAPVASTTFLVL